MLRSGGLERFQAQPKWEIPANDHHDPSPRRNRALALRHCRWNVSALFLCSPAGALVG